jgi:hypothetical protein
MHPSEGVTTERHMCYTPLWVILNNTIEVLSSTWKGAWYSGNVKHPKECRFNTAFLTVQLFADCSYYS